MSIDYEVIQSERGRPIKMWTRGVPVEEDAKKQLHNTAKLPFIFSHLAVMPDVHLGKGSTIGSVIPTLGAIIPAAVGVDIGCFTGDTLIPLSDGRVLPIHRLSIYEKETSIFAYTPSGQVVATYATAYQTRPSAPLVKVRLDNGQTVRCTPDHLFMQQDGSYLKAEELTSDVRLMSFDRHDNTEPPRKKENYYRKIVEVETLPEPSPVYCLTVPHYHNFALQAGVFVHNCGMMASRTSLTASDLPDHLYGWRTAIEHAVPHGRTPGARDIGAWSNPPAEVDAVWAQLAPEFSKIVEKYPKLAKVNHHVHLGTLGTGNHFIEVCLDEQGYVWFMLHSGSRGVGNAIGTLFIELAKKDMRRYFINLPDADLAYFPQETDYFHDYFHAVGWAQHYAHSNRILMMQRVVSAIRGVINKPFEAEVEAVNCHHNYVQREHHFGKDILVTRKGAVSARKGELGIIPGSMGARSYIVRGKGEEQSFCSCSHGAGRQMSRSEAKRRFTLSDHIEATQGVECRKDIDVIDEIPLAYKDIDAVMEAQSSLVEIVHTLKQVVCIKG